MHFSSALVVLTSISASNAFVVSNSIFKSLAIKVSTSEPEVAQSSSSTGSTLIPPISKQDENVLDIYNDSVQNTYGRYALTITHGKGCTLYSKDNKSYLDFVAGIATCALGHSNPYLTQAITDQMSTMHHISNLYYIPQQAYLAKWLTDNSVADKAFFCNSGAEANEAAIKCARKHAIEESGITDPVIITALNSFHGRTLAAITATGQKKYHKGFTYGGNMVEGFQYVDYNDAQGLKDLVEEINTTPEELKKLGRKRGVAAIMLETLQGEGGVVPASAEFLNTARDLCDKYNALLISDEVQVGMGRTGKLWGYEHFPSATPDIFTSAKALGGGVPIGAMMARGKAASTFGPGDHASTYGGNPLACASALAVAQYFSDFNLLQNVNDRSEQLISKLKKVTEKYDSILTGEVRGRGLLIGVVVKDNDLDINAGTIVGKAMEEGLLLVPAGPSVIRFVPPLIVTEEEVDKAVELFDLALQKTVSSN